MINLHPISKIKSLPKPVAIGLAAFFTGLTISVGAQVAQNEGTPAPLDGNSSNAQAADQNAPQTGAKDFSQPAADSSDPTNGGSGGGGSTQTATPGTTPDVAGDQTTPPPTTPPAEQPAPAPTRTGYHMRFVDVSPADKPNTVADQYCDYTMSDGTTQSVWAAQINRPAGFGQPIASYNENNRPGLSSDC